MIIIDVDVVIMDEPNNKGFQGGEGPFLDRFAARNPTNVKGRYLHVLLYNLY